MSKVAELFLLEDLEGEIGLFKIGLKQWSTPHNFRHSSTGEEALDVLFDGVSRKVYIPDLIILDLNTPRLSGLQVLKTIKNHPVLKVTPTVMFSNSGTPDDIIKCYEEHAAVYIQKPHDVNRFMEVIKILETFFFKMVRLPDGIPLGKR